MKTLTALCFAVVMVSGCAKIGAWLDGKTNSIPIPGTTTTTLPPGPAMDCGCSNERVPYTGEGERGNIMNPPNLRILINDHNGKGRWITTKARAAGAFDMAGNTYTFRCFNLEPGKRAHFLVTRWPSSNSPDSTANPATMGGGTKRAYYESRKPK